MMRHLTALLPCALASLINAGGEELAPPPSLTSSKCNLDPMLGSFGNFLVSDDADNDTPPTFATNGGICHDEMGFRVVMVATDANIFSPYTTCNSEVFVGSDVMEVFMAPVDDLSDDPQYYYELDTSPSGALWGGISNNTLGNSSVCIAENDECTAGTLTCSGLADFAHGMTTTAQNLTRINETEAWGWRVDLFVPWEIFAEKYQPKFNEDTREFVYHEKWRMNFYRYSYPDGGRENYELSGWSPTHDPSFHVPSKFGRVSLV